MRTSRTVFRFISALVIISLMFSNLMAFFVSTAKAATTSVTVAGSLQSEAGCSGDWDLACATTHMTYDSTDMVWQYSVLLPAGSYEYKAAINDSWTESYGLYTGPDNIPLNLAADITVKFYYDEGTHWITDNVNSVVATAAGSFQSELGCPGDWSPDCLRSWLQDVDGDGFYTFSTNAIPAGAYEFKVALDEGWSTAYPGGNVPFTVAALGQWVDISYDSGTNDVAVDVQPIGGALDNTVITADLYHDSRDPFYRTPGGPVTAGTEVKLRFRSASNDLTGAKVRVWDDRNNASSIYNMTKVATETVYDYWEVTVSAAEPTILWYRFIAQDGTATAYYEDDAARLGGEGQAFDTSPDNGWQLTVYDPAYTTPAWVKNAVVYQIFPDRFRDGNSGNNTPTGSFFYNEPGGTVTRSLTTAWNTPVCDPRETGACAGTYSKNFYGGDLQGIIDKLDYLQGLGVTAIYLNPIFESPSNHKYDTTDYGQIDDNFGDLAAFQTLASEAHNRGMHIILDGVFNHTSSDSTYFDRYGRYVADGACEAVSSDYRNWFYLPDVGTPGKDSDGTTVYCAGDPAPVTYESWWGYSSLPKLRANTPAVRALIWDGTASSTSAIAKYWLDQGADGWRLDVGGDVDPGLTSDPTNDYWEGFRVAIHSAKPESYVTGEEWGNASSWLLGNEWDGVMNYQFSSAVLSFWRDTTFVDNDHNASSSAGELAPLSPSQLNERLLNLQERYPAEALYAMLNLLGSHDTSRALFLLDENANKNDPTIYQHADYDWSDALTRLKGVAILQMTLPGAPTIYYGDEVGLVGPMAYSGGKWEDDPYNRQPYPWLDNSSDLPFYTRLQTQGGQDAVSGYYKLLTGARNAHPALRTGDFTPLVIDDISNVYAYGRKLADNSDAAIVIINRDTTAQEVTVDVDGYIVEGATLNDVLDGNTPYTVSGGLLTVTSVPAMSGAVLVLASGSMGTPPAAVTDLAASASSSKVDLTWTTASGATDYDVYRSLVSGGGYELIGTTTSLAFSDTTVSNSVTYYYVVISRDIATGLVSGYSNEANAAPAWTLDWYDLQWPASIAHTLGTAPTENVYGQVYIAGVTNASSAQVPGVLAQVGFGPQGSDHTGPTWTWTTAAFDAGSASGDNDQYIGKFLPTYAGTYDYLYRYSTDGGKTWLYGGYADPLPTGVVGTLIVTANSADTNPPADPTGLAVAYASGDIINLAWDAHPNTDGDLGGFELYRKLAADADYALLASVGPAVTTFTDSSVVYGETYDYKLLAFDTSYNRSGFSEAVEIIAVPRNVDVTFNVTIPANTPLTETVYIAGSIPGLPSWNPGATAMSRVSATQFTLTLPILDTSAIKYKYTRGSWDKVEKQADGNAEVSDRSLTVAYGSDGTQTVNDTVANWRDPFVTAFTPASGATDLPFDTVLTATWNQEMPTSPTCITLTGPYGAVTGAVTYSAADKKHTFTPAGLLPGGAYTANISGCADTNSDVQQIATSWGFTIMADTTAPTVDTFTATSPSPTLAIPITAFTASDNVGVTGYLITESATPPQPTDTGWALPAPTTYDVAANGTYYLYPWVKDADGNVSAAFSGAPVTVVVNTVTPPTAVTNDASGLTVIGATLNGKVNAQGDSTTVTFEYSTTPGAYTKTVTAAESPLSGSTDANVTAVVTGLVPSTTYYFRVVAQNAGGTIYGLEKSFKTKALIERLKNGSFETYLGISKVPRFWTATKFGLLDGKDSSTKKVGKFSVKITGGGLANPKTLSQTVAIGGQVGYPINLTVWVKGVSIPKVGACTAQVLLFNGATLKTIKTVKCASGTYTWQKLTLNFNAPYAFTKMVVKFTYKKSAGTVWFDFASLKR